MMIGNNCNFIPCASKNTQTVGQILRYKLMITAANEKSVIKMSKSRRINSITR